MSERHAAEGKKPPLISNTMARRIVGGVKTAIALGINENVRPIPAFPAEYPTLATAEQFLVYSGLSLAATIFAGVLITNGSLELLKGTEHKLLPEKKNPLE